MYPNKKREKAIELLIKYDYSIASVIAALGYPGKAVLKRWRKQYLPAWQPRPHLRLLMGFEFGQLSPKAYTSITGCTARINLWHGAVRSGKTISSLIAWGLRLSTSPQEGLYMMVGKISRALERNCVLPFIDIFGHATWIPELV